MVNFILGIHNHQPVGNFGFVLEHCLEQAYRPFLEVLRDYPDIKIALHYSGYLLEWLEEHRPQIFDLLIELCQKDQLEFLSGGFYEPILPVLPAEDQVGQIQWMNRYLEDKFRQKPQGLWLAERVWEPQLAQNLALAGIRYVVVDDSHFKASGLSDQELLGYYRTEDQGLSLAIFPIRKALRYSIPFAPPEKTLEHLKSVEGRDPSTLLVMADDGEKFGVWPGTHNTCYNERWLERFFNLLRQNRDWLKLTTFSQYLEDYPSKGLVYLPTASYAEMMEWALPAKAIEEYEAAQDRAQRDGFWEQISPFFRGGFWRNFFAKYPESNHMHKKMLYVSQKLRALNSASRRGAKSRTRTFAAAPGLRQRAEQELYRGQCNDAYWHGIFGGLYLPHLRHAVYQHLIQAETLLDPPAGERGWLKSELRDFDGDGSEELLLSTPSANYYFDLNYGGGLFELDYKPGNFNLINTLGRRREGYHHKISQAAGPGHNDGGNKTIHERWESKEHGLEEWLFYDNYRRYSFLDHFLAPGTDLEAFWRGQYGEQGDFLCQPYQAKNPPPIRGTFCLWREGTFQDARGGVPLRLEKSIKIHKLKAEMAVNYRLTNQGDRPVHSCFGVEFNFSLLSGKPGDGHYHLPDRTLAEAHLGSRGEEPKVKEVTLQSPVAGLQVQLRWNHPARWWRLPVETVSQSEGGFERNYQSSMLLPQWELVLQPGQTWSAQFHLGVYPL